MNRVFERLMGVDQLDLRAIRPGSPVVVVRVVMIGCIALAASFEALDHRWFVVGVLVAAALLQPLVAMIPGTAQHTWQRFFALDLAVGTIIALFEPSVDLRFLLLVVGLTGAAATCYDVVGFLVFTGAGLLALTTVLLVHDAEHPEQDVIAAAIIGLSFGVWMLRGRLIGSVTADDFRLAVDGAGGVFFRGTVNSQDVQLLGDIESLLGWRGGEREVDIRTLVHPDDFDDFWLDEEEFRDGAAIERTARFMTADGGWKWIHESSHVFERGGRLQIRGILLDHTAHIDGLERAKSEASTDSLTGLANRRVLVRLLDRQTVPGRQLALFDLDDFKRINDTLGHEAGDELLRIVAARVNARIRAGDLLVRLGGDEFAIVLDGTPDTEDARAQVERVVSSLNEPMTINGVVVNTSASAGLVREEHDAAGSIVMLRRADLAMYEAKRHGGGLQVFTEALEGERERRAELVRDLPGAIASGDLRLLFQPILDPTGTRVIGAEGLARWIHPRFGPLSPAAFLDVVLVSSQSGAFTRAMVGDAIDFAHRVRRDAPLQVAVNLPINTIEDHAFARWFFERCERIGVDPASVVFEMSERDLHGDQRTADAISRFAARGVTVSIDDFGTGHSTFDRLAWVDVAQLKIDRSLVQRAGEVERDATILRHVVGLAKELGYSIVGEGVETDAHRALLHDVGVDAVQGYLFSTALEADDFVDYLRDVHEETGVTAARSASVD